jgi:hypothetical protein
MSRPPKVASDVRVKAARIFVAQQILETGAVPAVRKLSASLGYAQSGARNTYNAVRRLASDPGIMYIETDWQNFVYPTEILEAMQEAARLVLEKEGVAL